MDDNFLYQNRPPVRSSFGENLYSHISSLPSQNRVSKNTLRFILRFALIIMLVFAALFTFSQPVRASVLHWLREIAGFEIEERNSLPKRVEEVSIPPDYHSNRLKEVIDRLPYKLSIPTYVPDGFSFEERVDVTDESIFMRWMNGDGDEILMMVDTDHGQRYVTGTNAAREIQINSQPALLIQGGYDNNNVWNDDLKMINVVQRKDDAIYWLIYIEGSGGEFDQEAIQNELIHMMSSLEN